MLVEPYVAHELETSSAVDTQLLQKRRRIAPGGVFVGTRVNSQRPALHGAHSILGFWCRNQRFPPPAVRGPGGVFCAERGAVSGHWVVFFALSVLATLSYWRSWTWPLQALWASCHQENKATTIPAVIPAVIPAAAV